MSKDLLKKAKNLAKQYDSIDNPVFVKSGSVVIDALLGGGIPKGTMIAWASDSGCGKSTSALFIAASYCAQGKRVLYLDFEGGVNKSQLDNIGLSAQRFHPENNPEGLFMCYQVCTYKDAETLLDELMEEVELVVIDSATAMLTEKVASESAEKALPGRDSMVMSTFLKKYKAEIRKQGCTWIIINQMRTKIRFIGTTTDEEAGGNALRFYPDIRIMMKKQRGGTLEREEATGFGSATVPFGVKNDVYCVKSRYSRPFVKLPLVIVFGYGVSNAYAYFDKMVHDGVVKREGAWYTIKLPNMEPARVQGQGRVMDFIEKNIHEVRDYIKSQGGVQLLATDMSGEEIEVYGSDNINYEDVKINDDGTFVDSEGNTFNEEGELIESQS